VIDPSLLERMKRDAAGFLDGERYGAITSDIACHVLALAEEVERLKAENAKLLRHDLCQQEGTFFLGFLDSLAAKTRRKKVVAGLEAKAKETDK
jgi:hypothetical protein